MEEFVEFNNKFEYIYQPYIFTYIYRKSSNGRTKFFVDNECENILVAYIYEKNDLYYLHIKCQKYREIFIKFLEYLDKFHCDKKEIFYYDIVLFYKNIRILNKTTILSVETS